MTNYLLIEFEKTGLFDKEWLNNQEKFEEYIEITFGKFEQCNYDFVVFSLVLELYSEPAAYLKNFLEIYAKKLKERLGIKKVFLILQEWYIEKFKNVDFNFADDVIYVNSFLYWCYYMIIKHKKNKHVDRYMLHNQTKFLLLTGKPNKIQRSGLLYKLYKRNLLNDANYSYIVHNDAQKQECIEVIKRVSDDSEDSIKKFIEENQKVLDRPDIKKVNTTETHYSFIPYDETIFKTNNFHLISETYYHYSEGHVISEKTWISIINSRPFIIVGENGTLDELKRMGFKTFENYLPHKNYNELPDNDRLDAVCDNVEYWIKNIRKHYQDILADTKHNYKNLKRYAKKQESILENFIQKNNLTATPEDLIPGYFTLPRI